MYWPEEDRVSVVDFKKIVEPRPPVLDKSCLVQVGRKTFSGVMVKVGTKKRITQLESQFIDECFDIQKPQNDGVEAGQENVATSSPKRQTSKSLVSKGGGSDAFHWLR